MTPSIQKWGLLLCGLGGVYALLQFVPLQSFFHPDTLTGLLNEVGVLGPIVLIGLMTLAVVVSPIPSLPIDLAAGAAYGPFWGGVYVLLGAELGAVVSFLIGRAIGREILGRWLGRDIAFCEQCSDHHLWGLLIVARIVPIFSFDIVSYGAGLTTMSLRVFALATFLGMIPPTFALTYLGSTAITVQWPLVIGGIILVAIFLLLPKWIITHKTSWWVHAIQGKPIEHVRPQELMADSTELPGESVQGPCAWCGKSDHEG